MHKFLRYFLVLFYFLQLAKAQTCPTISTYFGKIQQDEFKGMCFDKEKNIYAIGNTYNSDLPVTPGAFQTNYKANYETFLVKFDSCGTLIWCTYFGTQGFDSGEKIAFSPIDTSIVFTGYTDGSDLDTTLNCFQPLNNGGNDSYIAKFNLNGQAKWITYFGGTQSDFSFAITIDGNGNILVGGTSMSPTLYPNSQSFQPNLVGAVDAFIAKFDKYGQFKFSTFYGGTSSEDIHNIITDEDENIVAVGGSFSNNLNTSTGCMQASSNGGMEIYVLKLDSVGTRIFSTYIGGSMLDDCYGVNTDLQNNIYLTGHTSSPDFYYTAVSQQTTTNASIDNFCMKLTPTGSLVWSNIFGGSANDNNVLSKLDDNNTCISLINSQSNDFPIMGVANNTVFNGPSDFVIAKINSIGQLTWTNFTGGTGGEIAQDLFLLQNKIMVCGSSSSSDFPVLTGNYQLINNGQEDAFITTISTPISVGTSIKTIHQNQCTPNMHLNNNGLNIQNNCSNLKEIMITDILGRNLGIYPIDKTNIILNNLQINTVYFIKGFDTNNQVIFAGKLLNQP